MKSAEIICVGTELLMGNVINTNAAYLAEKLSALGFVIYHQSVVGDNAGRLKEEIERALERSDILVITGGLGPTEDDLTKETAAQVMGRSLHEDAEAKRRLQEYFASRGIELTDNNWKQALVPDDSIVLQNDNGTAPGIIMENESRSVILLPGPPREMKDMFEVQVIPYLETKREGVLVSKMIKICGVGESKVETMILDLVDGQTNPTIATYAKTGEVDLRVTASAADEDEARKLLKPMVRELKTRFGNDIFTTDEKVTLEKALVDLLEANKLTISTVESCTGGLLSARLTRVPGISEIFKAGQITYSNKAKRKLLDVKKSKINKYGAVSKEITEDMCRGGSNMPASDVIIAVTGHLYDDNPDGRPKGTVFIAVNVCGDITVEEFCFKGNRDKIRESAVSHALIVARKCVLKYYSKKAFGE